MIVIESGGMFRIYDEDSVITHKTLPAKVYNICFSEQNGIYLTTKLNVHNNEKIYGKLSKKIEKVFNAFQKSNRNFGVALSGPKGLGKTMWATHMIEKCVENGYPVLVVDSQIPNLTSFIESINQEVVVMFDEFDKVFYDIEDKTAAQDELLSMFDGITNTKKFFILTYNETSKVSKYLINRPGRIKYMFKVAAPNQETVTEYLKDNLNSNNGVNIINLATKIAPFQLSFDSLRAICEELNSGYSIEDTLEDLNIDIEFNGRNSYEVQITFKDGEKSVFNFFGNILQPINHCFHLIYDENHDYYGRVLMRNSQVKFTTQGIEIPTESNGVSYICTIDDEDFNDISEGRKEFYRKREITSIRLFTSEQPDFTIADLII